MAGNENMITVWPLPATDGPDAPFWAGAVRGELTIQACGDCGRLRFPVRDMCPHCHSIKREWRTVSGRGRVWSYAVPHPPLLPAFNDQAPYNVIVVELEEDSSIRLVGNLVASVDGALNEVRPDSIKIGEPVQALFVPFAEDVSLIRWVRR